MEHSPHEDAVALAAVLATDLEKDADVLNVVVVVIEIVMVAAVA